MIDIQWIDYGDWKNWESPWGDISIEQCPSYFDRGTVVFKTLTYGPVNLIFNPLLSNSYFFNEVRATVHLYEAIKLAQSLSDEQLRALKLEPVGPIKKIEGKDCDCILVPHSVTASTNWYVFDVKVHPGKEDFVVDGDDMFPRHYLDRDIAEAELQAWIQKRGQINETL